MDIAKGIMNSLAIIILVFFAIFFLTQLQQTEPIKNNPQANETLQQTKESIWSIWQLYSIIGTVAGIIALVIWLYYKFEQPLRIY